MLFKLSLKNIQKSIKDYAIYFFTLILGVAIFYVFNAIDSQTVMLDATASTREIIKLMTNMLSGVSVFVSFILGFLIIYASRFLIKRRNKEFGIYLTLGMSKRRISIILFVETLIIGVVSLIVGLLLGICLSQLMSVLVANMFEADMTKFEFIFSFSSCIKCLIYFGIMYLFVMIFNTYSISKCKLIDLIHGNKKSEKIKLKNPILCSFIFIIASCILGFAYYLVTGGFDNLDIADKIFIPIIMGSISTFFIFYSLSGLILIIVMTIKKTYYKGLNSFTLRQISSKVNTMVFSMTIICLMLFITICVLSSSLTLKNSLQDNATKLAPADIFISKGVNLDDSYTNYYNEMQIKNANLSIPKIMNELGFNTDNYLKDQILFSIYRSDDLKLNDTLESHLDDIKNQYRFLRYDSNEDIIKLSDYNRIARLYGNKEYTLNNDQYIIVADFDSMVKIRNIVLKSKESISVFGHELKPKYDECQNGFIELSSQHITTGIIIVPDSVIDEKYKAIDCLVANYDTNKKEEKQGIENMIKSLNKSEKIDEYIMPDFNTKIDIVEASVGLGALVTFIGLYLGIVFLISSAAILALKELSESSDNKERFNMLRKLGADESMINRALFRQIAIFFMFPLFIAIIHSIFGIMFCNHILETLGNDKLFVSIITTAIFIVLIYGGYFIITYLCSKNIIKDKYL